MIQNVSNMIIFQMTIMHIMIIVYRKDMIQSTHKGRGGFQWKTWWFPSLEKDMSTWIFPSSTAWSEQAKGSMKAAWWAGI